MWEKSHALAKSPNRSPNVFHTIQLTRTFQHSWVTKRGWSKSRLGHILPRIDMLLVYNYNVALAWDFLSSNRHGFFRRRISTLALKHGKVTKTQGRLKCASIIEAFLICWRKISVWVRTYALLGQVALCLCAKTGTTRIDTFIHENSPFSCNLGDFFCLGENGKVRSVLVRAFRDNLPVVFGC